MVGYSLPLPNSSYALDCNKMQIGQQPLIAIGEQNGGGLFMVFVYATFN